MPKRTDQGRTRSKRTIDRGGTCLLSSLAHGSPKQKKRRKQNAEKRIVLICRATGAAAPPAGGARLSAFHRGSCQRECFIPRLSSRPGFPGRGRSARSCRLRPTGGERPRAVCAGVTRPGKKPVPVQRSTSQAGRSAGRLMPEAARERFAIPPAGTALAPMSRNASGSPSFTREIRRFL